MRIFRVARPGSVAWNLTKTLLQVVVMWGTFLWLLPAAILVVEAALGVPRFTFPGQSIVAIALFALCGGLGLTSATWMVVVGAGTPLPLDSARRLVVSGPYGWVRNPMAIGGIGQGIAVGIGTGSWSVLGYAIAGAFVWNRIARPAEERDMVERFGVEYERYRARVALWWPRQWRHRVGR